MLMDTAPCGYICMHVYTYLHMYIDIYAPHISVNNQLSVAWVHSSSLASSYKSSCELTLLAI